MPRGGPLPDLQRRLPAPAAGGAGRLRRVFPSVLRGHRPGLAGPRGGRPSRLRLRCRRVPRRPPVELRLLPARETAVGGRAPLGPPSSGTPTRPAPSALRLEGFSPPGGGARLDRAVPALPHLSRSAALRPPPPLAVDGPGAVRGPVRSGDHRRRGGPPPHPTAVTSTLDGEGPPLRICLAHPYTWPAVRRGGERYLDDLSWWLRGRGHHVEVITGSGGTVGDPGVGVRCAPRLALIDRWGERAGLAPDDTFGLRALPLLVRRYDVVHALVPAAALAARAAGQRTVYTVLGHPTARALGDLPTHRRMLKAAARAATVTVGLSAASATAVSEVLGTTAEVLSPGVRLERFPASLGARAGPPFVVFPSLASDRRKRLDVLMKAFASLLRRRPDARLALVGPGDPNWALEHLAGGDRRAVESSLERPGEARDLAAWYRRASVTALPSVEEAFGLVLLESLASGTPVVCTDDAGMPEIVTDPAVGRAVPPDNPDALAAALAAAIDLAAQPGTPAACASHARQWGWQESAGPAHERLYRRVAAGRPRRSR